MSFYRPTELQHLTRRLNVLRLDKTTGKYLAARHFVPPFWTRRNERYPTFAASCQQIVAVPGSNDVILHLRRATNGSAVSASLMCTDAIARVDPCGCVRWWYHFGVRHTNGVPQSRGIVCDTQQRTTVAASYTVLAPGIGVPPEDALYARYLERITADGAFDVRGGQIYGPGYANSIPNEMTPLHLVPESDQFICEPVLLFFPLNGDVYAMRRTADVIEWSLHTAQNALWNDQDFLTRHGMTAAGHLICEGSYAIRSRTVGGGSIEITVNTGLTRRTSDEFTEVTIPNPWDGPDPAILAWENGVGWSAQCACSTGDVIYAITTAAPAPYNSTYCLTKFDLDFNVLWQRTVGNFSTYHLACDATGVYIAGPLPASVDVGIDDEHNIAKVSPDGDNLWFQSYSGLPTAINALAVGNDDGSLWVGGADYGI